MLYEWHWTTYFMFVFISICLMICIKGINRVEEKNVNRREGVYYSKSFIAYSVFFFALLLILPLSRNLDIYPTYEYSVQTGIRTIDPQAYVYQFKAGQNPGFNFSTMISLKQTEPMLYFIANLILNNGGTIETIWVVVFGLITICYWHFFKDTIGEKFNYLILFPFFSLYLYSMCAIRSGLSVAFFCASLACVYKKRKTMALVFLIVGFCFHYLILFGLMALIFNSIIGKIKKKRKILVLLFLISAGTAFAIEKYGASLIADTKYRVYLSIGHLSLLGQLPVLVLFVLLIGNYERLMDSFPNRVLFINLSIFSALIVPFVILFSSYRLGLYFLLARLFSWEMLVKLYNRTSLLSISNYRFRFARKSYCFYDCMAGILAFLWYTKQIFDMKGIGIMPLFSSFI